MRGSTLKPGDRVEYTDRDRVQWGPWEVVGVADGRATVRVDEKVELPVDCLLLRKATARTAT